MDNRGRASLYTYYSSSLGIALINRPDLKTQNPNFESTNMKRVFGVKKDKQPSPSIHDASDRNELLISRKKWSAASARSMWSRPVLEPTVHWTEGKRPRVLEVREKGPRQRRSHTDETREWVYGKEKEGAKPIASHHVVIASRRVAFTTIIAIAIAIASLSLSFDLRLTLYENHRSRINKRSETVDEKIKKLDAELARYKEQIKKTRPGPAQEAVKARAMRVLKQKRT
ncbi:hypothetical protein TEA_017593 [Camellia sinensis var. sinensis]|uniref:Uncharacterized protein n=1 Tax=Camellia sinensis var. sinensis TaxID=542762 RepID=A0A4S4ERR1_CAMSN|nr:hypothetical protein TEA_017593 [Camellia sinensis var. sinensis]